METTKTVREQIVHHAITLMMLRGYNGFSYRDLSELIGVKTSSIHYYFPSKDDLVLEAVHAYVQEVQSAVQTIDAMLSAEGKLAKFAKMFGRTLGDGNHICLCGMLAADIGTLPEPVRLAVQGFFKTNESWLAKVFADGARDGTIAASHAKPEQAARVFFAALQGAGLTSRLFRSKNRLDEVEASFKLSK
ncbi:TetR/AcrR family transcriptional regulator [Trinickia acidisoli]|uniref:TetR/AcrR family transcriptional regulator n=1 Tax=Trinickia acidisoli TaxID=2767482 RepID=UPI001A902C26|nr:TetR/AcrR family transcriptional regulator [Trinickia acidisoli]